MAIALDEGIDPPAGLSSYLPYGMGLIDSGFKIYPAPNHSKSSLISEDIQLIHEHHS